MPLYDLVYKIGSKCISFVYVSIIYIYILITKAYVTDASFYGDIEQHWEEILIQISNTNPPPFMVYPNGLAKE